MRSSFPPPIFSIIFGLILLPLAEVRAVDIVEEFDGVELDTNIWISTGPKTVSVGGGQLTWAADAGNWASGDITTVQNFFLPQPGQTTSIEWVMGSPEIETQNPDGDSSARFQLGVHSSNETETRREHWVNTTGGIWLDMEIIVQSTPGSISGLIRTANDEKLINTQGDNVADVTLFWNWQTEPRTIRLDLTDTEFLWYDNDVLIGNGTYADAGIDTEFDNGYKVLALGMNFDAGRASIDIDRIAITNAGEPETIIASFRGLPDDPVSNERLELSWAADPTATLSIDQGIGNVDDQTSGGVGALMIFAPVVESPMAVDYTLTATLGAEVETRVFTLDVAPAPEPFTENLFDDFEGAELDGTTWVVRGNKSHTVADSRVTWASDGGTWATGEINSVQPFPMPEAGKPTTITWTLGPGSVTTPGPDNRSIRPMLGIASSFERSTFTRAHYQNTSGGIWMDVESMGPSPSSISGQFYAANDTKVVDMNGTSLGTFDVPDWTWGTESHEFSLVLTNLGFTWFSGETELLQGNWADSGLDHEFINGFEVMALGGNWETGSGEVSYESIEVENGAAIGEPFKITSIVYDPDTDMVTLTWNSELGVFYSLDISPDMQGVWSEEEDSVPSQGESTSFSYPAGGSGRLFFQVRENQ